MIPVNSVLNDALVKNIYYQKRVPTIRAPTKRTKTSTKQVQEKKLKSEPDDDVLVLEDEVQICQKKEPIQKSMYVNIDYDPKTFDYYKRLREQKLDPFMLETCANPFKFHFKWNPYTGERMTIDEVGPLCFDPDFLIRYFWTNRLQHLWVSPTVENGGWQGYYDDAVGKGPDFNITGRGDHPEWHLFRLPIIDCYLARDHNDQLVTMGPMLSDKEVEEIYRLAKKNKDNYKNIFGKKRPDLLKIRYWYQQAIAPEPAFAYIGPTLNDQEKKQTYYEANTLSVLKLKAL